MRITTNNSRGVLMIGLGIVLAIHGIMAWAIFVQSSCEGNIPPPGNPDNLPGSPYYWAQVESYGGCISAAGPQRYGSFMVTGLITNGRPELAIRFIRPDQLVTTESVRAGASPAGPDEPVVGRGSRGEVSVAWPGAVDMVTIETKVGASDWAPVVTFSVRPGQPFGHSAPATAELQQFRAVLH